MTAPMNSAPDPARVAAGLTKAQKQTVMQWSGSHDEVTDPALDPLWFCIMKDGPGRFRLSPTNFGLAVRNHIMEARNEA